jgi:tetratricopeptide (TPR) repeat protein
MSTGDDRAWRSLDQRFSAAVSEDLGRLPWGPSKRDLAKEVRVHFRLNLPKGSARGDQVDNWLSGQLPKGSRGQYPRREVLTAVQEAMNRWFEDPRAVDAALGAPHDYVGCFLGPPAGGAALADAPRRAAVSSLPLPAPVVDFTGRRPVLAALRDAAARQVATIVVHGMPGVGKTSVAVHAAWSMSDSYPDEAVFLDLHHAGVGGAVVERHDALGRLLGAVGVPLAEIPDPLEDRRSLWRSVVNGRRMIVILDDAADAAQVEPLLPDCAGPLCIVTSRRMLPGLVNAQPVEVRVMDPAESIALLSALGGSARVEADPAAAERVVVRCGHLPLAIAIAGGQLRYFPKEPLADLAQRLDNAAARLDELTAEHVSVRAVFQVAYERLPAALQTALVLVGIQPGPIASPLALAALGPLGYADAQRALRQLAMCHLIDADTWTQHDLVRQFTVELAERTPSNERAAALDRLVASYSRAALIADLRLRPWDNPVTFTNIPLETMLGVDVPLSDTELARTWVLEEAPNFCAIIEARPGHDATSLADRVGPHLMQVGQLDEAERCLQVAAEQARTPKERSAAIRDLATLQARRGRYDNAEQLYGMAYTVADENDDDHNRAGALRGLADVVRRRDHNEAERLYLLAYELAGRAQRPIDIAGSLVGLGTIAAHRGDVTRARELLGEARDMFASIGDGAGHATTLRLLAMLAEGADKQRLQQESEALSEAIHDDFGRAEAMISRGQAALRDGDPEAARRLFTDVLGLPTLGYPARVRALIGLAQAETELGNPASAEERAGEAADLARERDDAHELSRALSAQAHAASVARGPVAAMTLLQKAIEAASSSGASGAEGAEIDARAALASLALEDGQLQVARDQAETAHALAVDDEDAQRQLQLARFLVKLARRLRDVPDAAAALGVAATATATFARLHDRPGEASIRKVIGDTLRLDRPDEAFAEYEAMRRLGGEAGDRTTEVTALLCMAGLRLDTGDIESARTYAAEAGALMRELDSPQLRGESEQLLGVIAANTDDLPGARRHMLAALDEFTAAGLTESMLDTLRVLAVVARWQKAFVESAAHLVQAMRLPGSASQRRSLCDEAKSLSAACLDTEPAAAHEALLAAAEVASALGNATLEAELLWDASFSSEKFGDRAEAAAEVRRAYKLIRTLGSEGLDRQVTDRLNDLREQ